MHQKLKLRSKNKKNSEQKAIVLPNNQFPTSIIVFGPSGDLTQRKLIPSFFNLFRKRKTLQRFQIIGFGGTAFNDQEFQENLRKGLDEFASFKFSEEEWSLFAPHLHYHQGKYVELTDFENLATHLRTLETDKVNRLFYLSIPTSLFPIILTNRYVTGQLKENDGWRQVMVEKPFGTDLASAKKLIKQIHEILSEDQIYRIDHYLGNGYCNETNVNANTSTPTYAALLLFINNWRWKDVLFFLRSGKFMEEKQPQIIIRFKEPPLSMFPMPPGKHMTPNMLVLYLQPDEGVHLPFEAKVPDTIDETRSVDMEFHYDEAFGPTAIPEAYERLLLDALQGDAALFTRADEVEMSWGLIAPILQGWETPQAPPLTVFASPEIGTPPKLTNCSPAMGAGGCTKNPTIC